jgi:hypothetical protein
MLNSFIQKSPFLKDLSHSSHMITTSNPGNLSSPSSVSRIWRLIVSTNNLILLFFFTFAVISIDI